MRKQSRRRRWDTSDNPVRAAILAAHYKGDATTMQIQDLAELAELKAGRMGPQSIQLLLALATISEKLAARGIGPEALPHCQRLRREVARLGNAQTPHTQLIDAAMELHAWHEAQREAATPDEYARCSAAFCRISE